MHNNFFSNYNRHAASTDEQSGEGVFKGNMTRETAEKVCSLQAKMSIMDTAAIDEEDGNYSFILNAFNSRTVLTPLVHVNVMC